MDLRFKKNVLLKDYSTFKIGGWARYFFVAKEEKELIQAIKIAKRNDISVFILGGGSNILFSDQGFSGLVIKMENKNFQFSQKNKLFAESGCLVESLISQTVKRGLSGLEWAGGLPGTLGGAIRGNAGAFGREIKDIIEKVITFSPKENQIKEYRIKDCHFGYRKSIFKENKEIILSAILSFKESQSQKLKKIVKENIGYRLSHHPLEYPSAGSIFKNIPLEKIAKEVKEKFKDKIKTDPFPLLPAAVLIAEAGLKGLSFGGAKISEKHPNFIVNFKNAKARDVFYLIKKIKEKVKKEFDLELEEEIELVGFENCH